MSKKKLLEWINGELEYEYKSCSDKWNDGHVAGWRGCLKEIKRRYYDLN